MVDAERGIPLASSLAEMIHPSAKLRHHGAHASLYYPLCITLGTKGSVVKMPPLNSLADFYLAVVPDQASLDLMVSGLLSQTALND